MTKQLFIAILFFCCANLSAMVLDERLALNPKNAKYQTYIDCHCINDDDKDQIHTINLDLWISEPPYEDTENEYVGPWVEGIDVSRAKKFPNFSPPRNDGVTYDKLRWIWSGRKKWQDTVYGGNEPIYDTRYETYTEKVLDYISESSSDSDEWVTYKSYSGITNAHHTCSRPYSHDTEREHCKEVTHQRPIEYLKGYTDRYVKKEAGWVYEVSKVEWHGTREKHLSSSCKKCLARYILPKLKPFSTAFCLVCGTWACHDNNRTHPCHCFRCISHDVPFDSVTHKKIWTDAIHERVESLGIYTENEIASLRENFESQQYFSDEKRCSCCNLF